MIGAQWLFQQSNFRFEQGPSNKDRSKIVIKVGEVFDRCRVINGTCM